MTLLLELSEYDKKSIVVSSPTPEDLELSARLNDDLERKLELRWLRSGRLEVVSKSWIGVIRLSSVTIQIRPKYAGNELGVVRMLEYAGGIGALRRTAAMRSLPPDGLNLLDLLCVLLAEESQLILRDGLLHDYSTEEESLPALRGSLRFREQATRRFGQLDVLECRFDDFHADVIENQLLRAGLAAATRVCGDRATKQRVRRLEHAVSDLASIGPTDSSYYRQRLAYGRKNERYRRAHQLALLLLDHVGVEDLYGSGRADSFAFLINMNRVFESFIEALVDEAFRGEPWSVSGQKKVGSVIRSRDTGKRYSSIVPDLVLSDRHQNVPFDCKYKLYGTKSKPKLSTSDIYQSFVYAYALSSDTPSGPRAGLIYPSTRSAISPRLDVGPVGGASTAALTGIAINVVDVLDRLDDPGARAEVLTEVRKAMGEVLEPVAS